MNAPDALEAVAAILRRAGYTVEAPAGFTLTDAGRAALATWRRQAPPSRPLSCTDSPACAARGCDDCRRSYGPRCES